MRSFVSQSVSNLRPSGIRRFFDIAATMDNVVTLGIGEPDLTTPEHIMDKGIAQGWADWLHVELRHSRIARGDFAVYRAAVRAVL
jgi:hypothetical protein